MQKDFNRRDDEERFQELKPIGEIMPYVLERYASDTKGLSTAKVQPHAISTSCSQEELLAVN